MSSPFSPRKSARGRGATPTDKRAEKAIGEFMRHDITDYAVISKLRQKYGDDRVVNAIFAAYKERSDLIRKKARKFKQLILERYSKLNLPLGKIMEKAKKHQAKYKLTDDEFQMFIRLSMSEESPLKDKFSLPSTAMSRLLGHGPGASGSEKLLVKEGEANILQDILRLHAASKELHNNVIIQSLTYEDSDITALIGEYDDKLHNRFQHIHPLLIAMFIPKIALFDEHMLMANISNIIKSKHEGNPIIPKPDFELLWDIIWDPNDASCSTKSPLMDLRNRAILQTRLWDCVYNLRQGKYFGPQFSEFMTALDECKNNIYDSPDLAFIRDEGTVMRRLMSAFSMRPTMVQTTPLYTLAVGASIGTAGVSNVTYLPIITVRPAPTNSDAIIPVDFKKSLDQQQWYVENKTLVPKKQQVISTRDILVFHVNRKHTTVHVTHEQRKQPFAFDSLPATMGGFQRLNTNPVEAPAFLTVGNDNYELRSFVASEIQEDLNDIIIGTSAFVCLKGNKDSPFVKYNPRRAGMRIRDPPGSDTFVTPDPFVAVGAVGGGRLYDSFETAKRTRGIVYIYAKPRIGEKPITGLFL